MPVKEPVNHRSAEESQVSLEELEEGFFFTAFLYRQVA